MELKLTTEGVRQQRHAVADEIPVDRFLQTAHVGYLGLVDGDEPYVVPLNFAWMDGVIYFHGAKQGRKADLMQNPCRATFTVAEEQGIITNPVPGKTDTAYFSVMLFGEVEIVLDLQEATRAMRVMLDKYVPGYYESPLHPGHVAAYVSRMGSHVQIYRITPDRVTAKRVEANPATLFYAGRTRVGDLRK